jgi:hypothetical protein
MSDCRASFLALVLAAAPAAAAERPLLGAMIYGGGSGMAAAPARLEILKKEGFRLVSLVPSWGYADLNRVDFTMGPRWEDVDATLAAALDAGFMVVLKPHLDPPVYLSTAAAAGHSWRKDVPWRGYFDLDPWCRDYREGVVLRSLQSIARALKTRPKAPPVRLELGSELMNSITYSSPRWLELLVFAKAFRKGLGLEGRVLLSYNFEHHFEIPNDVVRRMDPAGRAALASFIKGLDAVSLSQYMDLTVAVPEKERGQRLPTADEVAEAFLRHEKVFVEGVLEKDLGLKPSDVPVLHIGEFGVGTGGLSHPNEWSGDVSPERERALAAEIARGHEGLARYLLLPRARGRRVKSAILWTLGRHFDVFGWDDPKLAIPGAADADRSYLRLP